MLSSGFVKRLRAVDYSDIPQSLIVYPTFVRRAEVVCDERIEDTFLKDSGGNGIAVFSIVDGVEDTIERYFKTSIFGIDNQRREIFVLIADSVWLRLLIRVRLELLLTMKKIERRFLLTLAIWELAERTPGTYVSWADIKLVKSFEQLFGRR